jgi:hypothetical protein
VATTKRHNDSRRSNDVHDDNNDDNDDDEEIAQTRAVALSKSRAQRKRAKHLRRLSDNANDDDDDDDNVKNVNVDQDDDDIDSSEERGATSTLSGETGALVAATAPPPPSTGFDFGDFKFESREAAKQPRKKRRAAPTESAMTAIESFDAADADTGTRKVPVPRAAKAAVVAAAKSVFSKGDNVMVRINEPSRGELDANQLDALMESVVVDGDSET